MKIFIYLMFLTVLLSSCTNDTTKLSGTWITNSGETTSTENSTWTLIDNINNKNMDNSYQTSKLENWDLVAIMTTTNWTIKIKLFPKDVPSVVNNFIWLAKKWYYNGIIFHRVINNFMIQGGDPTWTGMWWESIYWAKFDDEFSPKLSNIRGSISMANAWPNTNGSQFFINQKDNINLDYDKEPLTSQHAVFWQVYEWMDNVDKIAKAKTWANDKPEKDIKIISIEIKKYENWSLVNYDIKVEDLIAQYKADKEKKKEEKKGRIIKVWDKISVNYTWKFPDWKVFDTSLKEGRTPIEFEVWAGTMIPWFDKAVIGMKIWGKKNITLEPKDAYWDYDAKKVQEVKKSDLKSFVDAWVKLEVWGSLPTQYWNFKIKEVKKDSIILDVNSEMAWKTLVFDLEIVDIK